MQRPPHQHRGCQILDRATDRLEQRDLRGRGAALDLAAAQIEQIAPDPLLLQHAGLQRLRDVAALFGGAGAGVDIDARAPDRIVVEASGGFEGSVAKIIFGRRRSSATLPQAAI